MATQGRELNAFERGVGNRIATFMCYVSYFEPSLLNVSIFIKAFNVRNFLNQVTYKFTHRLTMIIAYFQTSTRTCTCI